MTMHIVTPIQFYAMLHDPANGRYATSTVTLQQEATVKMIKLPDGVFYNPYGGGTAPIYPSPFTADFLFKGSTYLEAQTMYNDVVQYLGFTNSLRGSDANDAEIYINCILSKVVRTDTWIKQKSKVIKFQITFHPIERDWS